MGANAVTVTLNGISSKEQLDRGEDAE